MSRKVAIVSLGCPKNLTDSEVMLGQLLEDGYEIVSEADGADVLLINTCAFLESARDEAYQVIEEFAELKQSGKVKKLVIAGCLPIHDKKKLQTCWPEIDLVIGPAEIYKLAALLNTPGKKFEVGKLNFELIPANRVVSTIGGSAYLKIAEGCSHGCSFCTIPRLRGPLRSKPLEVVLAEAETLIATGVRELVLVAQDTTAYGVDRSGKSELPELLRKLAQIKIQDQDKYGIGLKWIRIMYAYPEFISDELIEVIASEEKVCNYLDLPLQHIDNEILKSMRRRVNEQDTRAIIKKLKKEIPDIALRTTFIVGYPGEQDEQFENLLEFVKETEFSRLGAFIYSREPGTAAAKMREVAKAVQEERYDRLLQLQNCISKEQNKKMIGKELNILMETAAQGRSYRDAPEIDGCVMVDTAKTAHSPGDLVTVKITRSSDYDLGGTALT